MPHNTLWLHLHFPQLPLDVFNIPDDGKRSIVVSEKQRICRMNTNAAEHGIREEMSLATARALCDPLQILERQPRSEHALLRNLADWAYRFSSLVCVEPPDGLALEIAASERLFGQLDNLIERLANGLDGRSIRFRCGLAPGPEGARLLARASADRDTTLPGWIKDDGIAGYRKTIRRLPIAYLDCSATQQQRMQQSGFQQVGDLLALPREAIGKRFGKTLLDYLRRLNIEQPESRKPYTPPEYFRGILHFPEPMQDNNGLLFPMQRLLRELEQFLARRQSFARQIDWQFSDSDGHTHTLPIACSLQYNSLNAMFELTRLAMDTFTIGSTVESLALDCQQFSRTEQRSDTLFNEAAILGERQQEDALRLLLDRLSIRLGESAVFGLQVCNEHLPEQAWVSMAPALAVNTAQAVRATRPLWLLQHPRPLRSLGNHVYGDEHMELLSGPERIDAEWWSNTASSRDYHIATDRSGVLFWIFRDRVQGQWYLHGLFG